MDALKRQQKAAIEARAILPIIKPEANLSKKRKTPTPTAPVQPLAPTSASSPSVTPLKKKKKLAQPPPSLPAASTSASTSSLAPVVPAPSSTTTDAEAETERKRAKKQRKLERATKRESNKSKGKGNAVDRPTAPPPPPTPVLVPIVVSKATAIAADPEPKTVKVKSRLELAIEATEKLKKSFKPVKPPKAPKASPSGPKRPKTIAAGMSAPKVLGEASACGFGVDFRLADLQKDHAGIVAQLPKLVTEADNQAFLTSKWFSTTDLEKLTKLMGLKFKKGRFTKEEDALITAALNTYKSVHVITDDQITDIVFAKGAKERAAHSTFFQEITQACPGRPVIAIYHHLHRIFHPLKGQGRWTEEQDDKLKAGIITVGTQWELLEPIVGRSAFDCRDRWRNHLDHNDGSRTLGFWSKDEEDKLSSVIASMKRKNKSDDIYWAAVAEQMGHTRGRAQCRSKWNDILSTKTQKEKKKAIEFKSKGEISDSDSSKDDD